MGEKKINILFIFLQMGMGGSERLVHNLVSKINRIKFNPSIAWFYGDDVLEEFRNLKVPIYRIRKERRFDCNAMMQLAQIIKGNNINVVNAHHFMSMVYSFYGCKIANNAKLVYTEHSKWEIEEINRKWIFIGNILMKFIDAAVGVSKDVEEKLIQAFKMDPRKCHYIKNGIDVNVFDEKKNEIREEVLGFEKDEHIIGVVANFKKVKNHKFLLQAFREIIEIEKKTKLILVGKGFQGDAENTEGEIREYIRENGLERKVTILGYRSDIPEILKNIDIFCLTSFKEGLPISLIEAMASGIPVIGTNVEGIRDVIIPGRNGFLVENMDINSLKDKIVMLLKDDEMRKRYGHESRKIVLKEYSLTRCITEYEKLFS